MKNPVFTVDEFLIAMWRFSGYLPAGPIRLRSGTELGLYD
jgi:hypothetical protein